MAASIDPARERAKAAVQDMLDTYLYIKHKQKFVGYDVEFMEKARLIEAGPKGTVVWELDVTPFYGNLDGVMHGGAAGVIFDMGTMAALCPISRPGYWEFMGGVTRALNISYLRAVPVSTTIRIHGTVLQHGRTMALIQGRMESLDGKTTYATCEHHKVNVPSPPEHVRLRKQMLEEKKGVRGEQKAKL